MQLSQLANKLTPSQTRLFDNAARALKENGKPILLFTLGEPDFPSPKNVKRAAIKAIKENYTHYTVPQGIAELRKAVCEKFKRDNGISFTPEQILITTGAAQALYLTFQCILNSGDEVIFLTPAWPVCISQVKTTGAIPITVQCREENNFEPKVEDIRAALTAKTKAIVINSPCNPTGAMISEKTIKQICELCSEKNLWLVSDEVYEKISYGYRHVSPAAFYEKTIIINSVSKSYAMTGWRLGFVAGPIEFTNAATSLSSILTSNTNSISQKAALEALTGPQGNVNKMKSEFRKRRDLIVKLVNEIPGVHVSMPKGAFYAFVNVSQLFGKKSESGKTLQNSLDVADYFLNEAFVATVPGKPFGSDEHVRFSYACSQEQIIEGMKKIAKAVAKLR